MHWLNRRRGRALEGTPPPLLESKPRFQQCRVIPGRTLTPAESRWNQLSQHVRIRMHPVRARIARRLAVAKTAQDIAAGILELIGAEECVPQVLALDKLSIAHRLPGGNRTPAGRRQKRRPA